MRRMTRMTAVRGPERCRVSGGAPRQRNFALRRIRGWCPAWVGRQGMGRACPLPLRLGRQFGVTALAVGVRGPAQVSGGRVTCAPRGWGTSRAGHPAGGHRSGGRQQSPGTRGASVPMATSRGLSGEAKGEEARPRPQHVEELDGHFRSRAPRLRVAVADAGSRLDCCHRRFSSPTVPPDRAPSGAAPDRRVSGRDVTGAARLSART
jgi:hypothetical protein